MKNAATSSNFARSFQIRRLPSAQPVEELSPSSYQALLLPLKVADGTMKVTVQHQITQHHHPAPLLPVAVVPAALPHPTK